MEQTTITSNNNSPILASKGSRIFASLIDFFISLLIGIPVVYFIFIIFKDPIIGGDVAYDDIYQILFIFFFSPVISITFICPIFEFLASIGKNTNTLGKRLANIKIINKQDGRIKKRNLLMRSLLKIPYYILCMTAIYANIVMGFIVGGMMLLIIILLFIFVFLGNSTNQGLHNKLAGTSIICSQKK
ncbi:RDD family protein [Thorsellia anophelis]|uniref:RDD family protein n=1 Tax=Thorsellia anophelis DSM 18579 TaxID=1123402 RepID=A0A1H9ZVZ7_9GAMM|nr:RDD family protein [Thorsellia anophelis]SES85898.1 RDD family protein [Thorsellia anophelis DSM 18579]